ncbi:MAG: NAD(P)H-hydrate dehydratase [Saprospiraceae bacterium]|nr:NAD(P)H-hydrate dehydratase [Saprospiraceae bacterium]
MKPVYNAMQLKAWDQFTIENEPIKPIDLMERAADCFVNWMVSNFDKSDPVFIVCGNGNNGGDGLAIARKLLSFNFTVSVVCIGFAPHNSPEYEINLNRLESKLFTSFKYLDTLEELITQAKNPILIDALLGYGMSRGLSADLASAIKRMNTLKATRIAIDLPSGLYSDKMNDSICIHADFTFTFQSPKLSHLIADTGIYCGKLIIGDIKLNQSFIDTNQTDFYFIALDDIKNIFKSRNQFAYKNQFGHCLLVGGSFEMPGAILLSADAALRSGAGLISVSTVASNRDLLLLKLPEVQFVSSSNMEFSKYKSLLIGPGMGRTVESQNLLYEILNLKITNLVLDADALNMIAENHWQHLLTPNTIITPHVGEFDRLFGKSASGFERIEKAKAMASKYSIYIVLKGKYTAICTPQHKVYFNSSGNAGLAKAGSGDVLAGILVSLLAQSYPFEEACILGVYLHGLSADICAKTLAEESMTPSDVILHLSQAFKTLTL